MSFVIARRTAPATEARRLNHFLDEAFTGWPFATGSAAATPSIYSAAGIAGAKALVWTTVSGEATRGPNVRDSCSSSAGRARPR